MTHFRIKNCSRINYIQPIGVRLAVFCQHNINLSSELIIIFKVYAILQSLRKEKLSSVKSNLIICF